MFNPEDLRPYLEAVDKLEFTTSRFIRDEVFKKDQTYKALRLEDARMTLYNQTVIKALKYLVAAEYIEFFFKGNSKHYRLTDYGRVKLIRMKKPVL